MFADVDVVNDKFCVFPILVDKHVPVGRAGVVETTLLVYVTESVSMILNLYVCGSVTKTSDFVSRLTVFDPYVTVDVVVEPLPNTYLSDPSYNTDDPTLKLLLVGKYISVSEFEPWIQFC